MLLPIFNNYHDKGWNSQGCPFISSTLLHQTINYLKVLGEFPWEASIDPKQLGKSQHAVESVIHCMLTPGQTLYDRLKTEMSL